MLAVLLGGCATITRGTTTTFVVETTPPGAQVKTSTSFWCAATPCTFRLPRKEAFDVTVSKAGFKSITVHVKSVYAAGGGAGFLGNAVYGGVIGAGVDGASGAMKDLQPNPLRLTLEPADSATTTPVASIRPQSQSPVPNPDPKFR
jgi:hypothetical protein